jgi:hypothetical protein
MQGSKSPGPQTPGERPRAEHKPPSLVRMGGRHTNRSLVVQRATVEGCTIPNATAGEIGEMIHEKIQAWFLEKYRYGSELMIYGASKKGNGYEGYVDLYKHVGERSIHFGEIKPFSYFGTGQAEAELAHYKASIKKDPTQYYLLPEDMPIPEDVHQDESLGPILFTGRGMQTTDQPYYIFFTPPLNGCVYYWCRPVDEVEKDWQMDREFEEGYKEYMKQDTL